MVYQVISFFLAAFILFSCATQPDAGSSGPSSAEDGLEKTAVIENSLTDPGNAAETEPPSSVMVELPSLSYPFPQPGPEAAFPLPPVISPFRTVEIPASDYFSMADVKSPAWIMPQAPKLPESPAAAPSAARPASAAKTETGLKGADAKPEAVKEKKPEARGAEKAKDTSVSASKPASDTGKTTAPFAKKDQSPAKSASGGKTGQAEKISSGNLKSGAAVKSPGSASVPPVAAKAAVPARTAAPSLPAKEQNSLMDSPAGTVLYKTPGTIEISLEKPGWIYAGEKDGKSGIVFESRQVFPDRTLFRFSLKEEERYRIVFQLQDRSGKTELSEINLEKDKGMDGKAAVVPSPYISITGNSKELSYSGPASGSNPDSDKYPYPGFPAETGEKGMLPDNVIAEAASFAEGGNIEMAIELLEMVIRDNPLREDNDKVYYLLGRYYEADSSRRNASKSVFYYEQILDNFPLSDYINEADERIRYLRKHFIHIR